MGVKRANGWPCFVITMPSGGKSSKRERMRRRTSVAFSFILKVYTSMYRKAIRWLAKAEAHAGRLSQTAIGISSMQVTKKIQTTVGSNLMAMSL